MFSYVKIRTGTKGVKSEPIELSYFIKVQYKTNLF